MKISLHFKHRKVRAFWIFNCIIFGTFFFPTSVRFFFFLSIIFVIWWMKIISLIIHDKKVLINDDDKIFVCALAALVILNFFFHLQVVSLDQRKKRSKKNLIRYYIAGFWLDGCLVVAFSMLTACSLCYWPSDCECNQLNNARRFVSVKK